MRTNLSGILTLLLAFVVHISFAQEKTISGMVSDQSGLPLPGVNIVVVGTTTGTQTDFDGNYSIKASEGQTLMFTYIGQKEVRRTIGAGVVAPLAVQQFELRAVRVHAVQVDRVVAASVIPAAEDNLAIRHHGRVEIVTLVV